MIYMKNMIFLPRIILNKMTFAQFSIEISVEKWLKQPRIPLIRAINQSGRLIFLSEVKKVANLHRFTRLFAATLNLVMWREQKHKVI